jgi:hypothetical protein
MKSRAVAGATATSLIAIVFAHDTLRLLLLCGAMGPLFMAFQKPKLHPEVVDYVHEVLRSVTS